jgi:1,4-alpha-glucan branching enzyme
MSIRKQYLKNKTICRVTFSLSKEEAGSAEAVHLVGEFNNWSLMATPMQKYKNGNFSITLDLEKAREYQFKYLLDGQNWVNDPAPDTLTPVPELNTENSVAVV